MAISLPNVADLDPAQREVYDLFPANLSRGLVMTKASGKPYLGLGLSFRAGALSPEVRELVILRVGAVTNAQYEIHHHVPEARTVGVPGSVINAVLSGAAVFGDRRIDALIAFVDDLLTRIKGAGADTTGMQEFFSDNEIAEITLLTGHYVMTAMFIKTLGVVPETDAVDGPSILAGATAKLHAEQTKD
ncbi:carboxymuconolactone decarboxylase family protein [Mycobacteroides immunogenum]|uniref:Carboxymuconolactone decarboxylase n=1 Tax=Mycobacteroides immunogenum TaxID=83262 RepID=A0A7V8RYI4_9MYCO|nr:carboxymuconolactone decarboxylase family protein [Mycobacteroides immunogenum]AMT73352.1 carboxymuconolactone decarboxylase [Mycobacteroides immunogenum]ANO06513.1 carboxymuconolactone decarboxylase [Mycobacteroides immunogenum]KIU39920.1 carboxymuconolactone decarboxylase [Mycobacteroides immunogenum]KPG10746.1 carboxymuconolactone decarboxylase [Mycobacteroides immunogenum]KPG12882.1 carboxymuconolactone decarboxylase [Mycobacteroides immunogenum]